jgi:hypothetical protein
VPNPVDPQLAAKRLNQVLNVPRGFPLTHDTDVLERRYLIVDLDPVRYAEGQGQDCPTAAHELLFARRIARDHVRPFLADLGFGQPLVMLSGNGIHLVYQTQPAPARSGIADPGATVFRLLDERFTCLGLKIDPNTYTPARMLKVPGTLARKGEPARARPHRAARILEVPDGWRQPEQPPTCDSPSPAAAPRSEPDRRPDQARLERRAAKPAAPAEVPRLFDARPGSGGEPVH